MIAELKDKIVELSEITVQTKLMKEVGIQVQLGDSEQVQRLKEELSKFNEYKDAHLVALTHERDALTLEKEHMKRELDQRDEYINVLEQKQRKNS